MATIDDLSPALARHRVLDTRATCEFVGLSVAQWRAMRLRGEAPEGVLLGRKKQGWRVGTLIDWLESRQKQSKQTAA